MAEENTPVAETVINPTQDLNFKVMLVKELYSPQFIQALLKLKDISIPISEKIEFKALLKFLDEKMSILDAQKNEIVEKHGTKDANGAVSVVLESLSPEKKEAFLKDWNDLMNTRIELNLSVRFHIPHSEASLTTTELEMLERFLLLPGQNR